MKNHIPRKRFGQHFLADAAIVAAIVDAIAPKPGEMLVEIGPGLAALTGPLLARVPHLHVVEIDRDIVAHLKKTRTAAELTIHQGDALEFDFGAIGSDLRIIGNLPYNISTPLLFHLADYAEQVRDMHFMLQREVVARMVAEPGGGDFGRLSVMLQFRFHMEWLLDVPPEAFDPPPKVESAVVRMIPKRRDELPDVDEATLRRVVTAAFGQRRKMLRNTLRGIVDEPALLALGIAPTLRAEDVAVAGFVRIAQAVAGRPA